MNEWMNELYGVVQAYNRVNSSNHVVTFVTREGVYFLRMHSPGRNAQLCSSEFGNTRVYFKDFLDSTTLPSPPVSSPSIPTRPLHSSS